MTPQTRLYRPCLNCGMTILSYIKKQKFCSKSCYRKADPTYRGKRKADRGWNWRLQKEATIARDGGICKSLLHDPSYVPYRVEKCSVDHIFPYRVVVGWESIDPNHLDNLISFCRRCHQIKTTRIEAILLRGDTAGFIDALSEIIPGENLERVQKLAGGREVVFAKDWTYKKRPSGIKRRNPTTRGERHWKARLTGADVDQILSRKHEDRNGLAEEFGVSKRYVNAIICGVKWGWKQTERG